MKSPRTTGACRNRRPDASRLALVHAVATRLARVSAFELSPAAFRRVALAAVLALWVIVATGAAVRLTGSGLL